MKQIFLNTQMVKATMKTAFGLLMTAAIITGCSKDDDNNEEPEPDKTVKVVEGTLTGEHFWSADTVYLLRGFVRVGSDNGTTISATGKLTIAPGTLILGDRETKGTLVIQRGSQIIAQGEEAKPIVFTSERAVGLKQPGDWGGLVLCGKATNNVPGGVAQLEGGYGAFHGGTDDDDNSGILKYVRIEYAGIAINPNEEVNSLTLGSVGRGTVVSYVQASYGLDDAFEWFGGTVNCDHLIAYRNVDDDMDVDLGYSGNVQFALTVKDPNLADQSGSNGFEVDNNGTGGSDAPFTSGKFSNITVLGPKANRETTISTNYQNALHLRRNNKLKIYNSFFTGFPNGVFVDGASTVANAQSGDLAMRGNVLAAVENWGGSGFGNAGTLYVNATVGIDTTVVPNRGRQHPVNPRGDAFKTTEAGFDVKAWFESNNTFLPKWQDAGIDASAFDLENPKFTPNGGSVLLSGADFSGLSGFQSVSFRGAFGAENWANNWTEFNPNAKNYLD